MNSTAKIQLKSMGEGYALVVDGEESEEVDYGQPLEMTTKDGRRFIAFVDVNEKNEKDVESVFEFWAYEVSPAEDVQIVDEDDDEDGDDEDEDEGQEQETEGEQEDEEEEETVPE